MKHRLNAEERLRLGKLAERAERIRAQLAVVENQAADILGLSAVEPEEIGEQRDALEMLIWNGCPVEDLLAELGITHA